MATQIQLRRDTAVNWTNTNPTMAQGEAGYETDTGKLKVGDGTTAWNSLVYQAAANIVDGTIVNADINASAGIVDTKLATIATAGKVSNSATTATDANTASAIVARDASGNFSAGTITANLTGTASAIADNTVTSAKIVDGTIVDVDINASAEIAVSKLADGSARQLLQTDSAGTGVEWTDNVDVPGTLDVTGATTLDSTLSVPLGTEALPSIYPGTDTNTGIYSPGADQVAISTNGTGRLFVDASGNTSVGGVSITQRRCEILGEGFLTAASAATNKGTIVIHDAGVTGFTDNGGVEFKASAFGSGYGARLLCIDSGELVFGGRANSATWSERMRLDSSGRLGLGTSSPGFLFQAAGGIASVTPFGQLTALQAADGTGFRWTLNNNGTFALQRTTNGFTNATTPIFVDSSDRVGIGTTAPLDRLHIASTGECKLIIGNEQTNTDGRKRSAIIKKADNNLEIRAAESAGAQEIIFTRTTTAESARIDSSGRVLIGTSTAVTDAFGGVTAFQLVGGNGYSAGIHAKRNDAFSNALIFTKARGTAWEVVSNGDRVGSISFQGADGSGPREAASISVEIDGAVTGGGAADMPGRLVFSTTADGASSSTERVRISANGLSTFGTEAASGAALSVTAPAKLYTSTGTYTDTATAASGTVTHGTIAAFNNPAIAATNATVTYTNASTVYIDGAPDNGTNVTITNPYALYVNAGTSFFGGNVNLSSGNEYRINNTKVVGARITGWTAATGTATRTTFATSTVTTAQLAERVKGLIDDLISHGLIGT